MIDAAALMRQIEEAAATSYVVLPPGATSEAIATCERELGHQLPQPMRAFYLAHDGGGPERQCRGHRLLSLESIVVAHQRWASIHGVAAEPESDDDDVHPVQQRTWVSGWIPITTDDEGTWLMVDLVPGPGGSPGQVIMVDETGPNRFVEGADGFLAWLSSVAWYDASLAPGVGEDDEEDEEQDEDEDE